MKNYKKKRKPNKYQFLIGKFCKYPANIWADKGKVRAEMAVAKKLYKIYPSEEFWKKIFLSFKINSLRWFLTPNGKSFLRIELKKQLLDFNAKPSYPLGKRKVGKDKKVTRKTKTIKDFLKHNGQN